MSIFSSLGNVVGSVIGGVGSLLGVTGAGNHIGNYLVGQANAKDAYNYQTKLDAQNQKYNKELQKYAYDLNQQGITNAPSLLRKGYEKANLNPILAYQNTNAPSVNATGFSSSPGGAIATQAQSNAIAQQQANAQINFTNAQAQLSKEQAKTEMYKRDNFEADSLLKYVQSVKTDKEASWVEREKAAQIESMIMSSKAQQVASNASMINARTNEELQRFEKDIFRRDAEWRKRHPVQSSWQAGVGTWSNAIGRFIKPR